MPSVPSTLFNGSCMGTDIEHNVCVIVCGHNALCVCVCMCVCVRVRVCLHSVVYVLQSPARY